MDKQKILIIFLFLVIIAFSIYTAKNFFDSYTKSIFDMSYSKGYTDAVNDLIKSAEDESCEVFSVYNNDKEVNLINIDCLYEE
ncbi:MAG: hypothetical protein PWQ56_385 [Patescibacteria group bacterium]|nr:hypothetical protein [Patescibacteria group bacterium]